MEMDKSVRKGRHPLLYEILVICRTETRDNIRSIFEAIILLSME